MLKIGFSGTQEGMTTKQKKEIQTIFETLQKNEAEVGDGKVELHHGDCIGADEQAHNIAKKLGLKIIIHPPSDSSKRAYCAGSGSVRLPKPYLERNKHIVDETKFLIATPKTEIEELRSGTWSTIRYAKKRGKDVMLVVP